MAMEYLKVSNQNIRENLRIMSDMGKESKKAKISILKENTNMEKKNLDF